jgi:hypothetical protein
MPEPNPTEAATGAGMDRVSDVTLPKDAPRNPDGSPATTGEVSVDQAQAIGAVTLESAQRNKAHARVVEQKATGYAVRWNEPDALKLYYLIKQAFPHEWNGMFIYIYRISPEPVWQLPPIKTIQVPDPQLLYNYVDRFHGSRAEATYEVFFKSAGGQERGSAKIEFPDRTMPSGVEVISPASAPVQPPPQGVGFAPPGYPPGYPYPPPYGAPPPPYAPPAPLQAQQPIVVIRDGQKEMPMPLPMPPYPMPAPAPSTPSPVDAALPAMQEFMRSLAAQNAVMMETVTKAVERMTTQASRPAGFVELPPGYPIAPGYVQFPGGMIPDPNRNLAGLGVPVPLVAAAPIAPVTAPIVAPAPAAQPAPAQAPAKPGNPVAESFAMIKDAMESANKFRKMLDSFSPPTDEPEEPEIPAPPPDPKTIQDVAGISMVFDRATGKTDWGPTLLAALPKIFETGKGVFDAYQRTVAQKHAVVDAVTRRRIEMAQVGMGRVPMQGRPRPPLPQPTITVPAGPPAPMPMPSPQPPPSPVATTIPAPAPVPTTSPPPAQSAQKIHVPSERLF